MQAGVGGGGPSGVALPTEGHRRLGPVVSTIIAAALVAFSLRLTWLHAGLGDDIRRYPGSRLFVISLAVLLGSSSIAVAALVDGAVRRRDRLLTAATISCVMTAGTGLLLLLVEAAAGLIPRSFLPATVRRLTVDLGAGPGLWLAFGGSVCAALAAAAPPWSRLGLATSLSRDRSSSVRTAAVLALLGSTVVFGWARYEPWVNASAGGDTFALEGWSTPWLGPLSLIALWGLVISVTVLVVVRVDVAALIAAGSAWLASFLGALAILSSGALGQIRIADRLPVEVRHLSPAVGSARGAWFAFASGLVAAGAAALILASRRPVEGSEA